ncbi:hypothetical protein MAE02_52000 [Microvirga aerophila]|uniref:Uncharacterized protein n=1 Tax=Microvirga aerophila TaxID=670291 RepID=A0A512BZW4_9HYPH|nr:hypothetical protein MAE02_52000 [Microvirga aerophila]
MRSIALAHERAIIDRTPRQIGAIRKWARGITTKAVAGEGAELGGLAIHKRAFVYTPKLGAMDRLKTSFKPVC